MLSGGHFQALEIRDRLEYLIQIQILGGWMFGENAEKLYQYGLSIIPLENGKGTFKKGWTKYCTQRPSEEQIEKWIENEPNSNIGLPCGPANNITAIDIDTDNKFILNLLPKSQYVKKGLVGETRFFAYHDGIPSTDIKDGSGNTVVQILSTGRQTAIPPSIHPDTGKEYQWTGGGKLEDLRADAPSLPKDFIELINYLKEHCKSENRNSIIKKGRHNKLMDIAVAACWAGETDQMVLESLIEYDNKHHNPPWFTDPKEPQTPEQFLASIRRIPTVPECPTTPPKLVSVNEDNQDLMESNDRQTLEIKQIQELGEELALIDDTNKIPFEPIPIPGEDSPLLYNMYKQIQAMSSEDITPLAIASAHAIISTLFGHRFHIHRRRTNDLKLNRINIWPHGYNLCISPSGWGKSFGPNFLQEELYPRVEGLEQVIKRCGGFGSGHGVVYELQENPVTLAKLEEVSQLFRLANDGIKQKDNLAEILCEAWSNAPTYIKLGSTKESKKTGDVMAYNPSLTILGFTTEGAFRDSASEELNRMGLIPRFKIFDCTNWKQDNANLVTYNEDQVAYLVNKISNILDGVNIFTRAEVEKKNLRGPGDSLNVADLQKQIVPHQVKLPEELARDVLEPIQIWSNELKQELSDHPVVPYVNRCVEHVLLTALEHRLSCYDWPSNAHIYFNQEYPDQDTIEMTAESIDYGLRSFKHGLWALNKMSVNLSKQGGYARAEEKILKCLGDAGPEGVLQGRLSQIVRSEKRARVLFDLRESGRIVRFMNGRKKYYVLSEFATKFKQRNPYFKVDNGR